MPWQPILAGNAEPNCHLSLFRKSEKRSLQVVRRCLVIRRSPSRERERGARWRWIGEPARSRTENQQIKSLLLCQLSYGPVGRRDASAPRTPMVGGCGPARPQIIAQVGGTAGKLLFSRVSRADASAPRRGSCST